MFQSKASFNVRKFISLLLVVQLALSPTLSHAQSAFVSALSQPGLRVNLSPAFAPPLLKGVKVYSDNLFKFDFILDKGDSSISTEDLKTESTRLIKYFLASLTVPEKDLWVNLSPYEKDRIVPKAFGITEMGRDLLAQDYMLKQITASVIYPEEAIGKEFWNKVYMEAQKRFGTTDIPVDAFNKVWIVPERAVVFESKDSAYVVESRLKVMLETDYLATNRVDDAQAEISSVRHELMQQILRDIVIPILEKEVNEGKNFVQLRQVYHSLILAIWFKDKIKESVFGQAYVDRDKVAGVDIRDKAAKDKIWTQYVEAFKKGAYNYIKEDIDPATQQAVPRKYFSGGAGLYPTRSVMARTHDRAQLPKGVSDRAMIVGSNFIPFTTEGSFYIANAIPEGAVPFREGTFASLIDFLPSLRCQLKCRQCWARNFYTQKEILKYGTKEPSFGEILHTIDLLAETGIEGISFSGGEPTIVPRFDEIIAYVKAKGMKVFVNTNGLQFKKIGGDIFIELYKEDRKSTYLVPLEKFISNIDQFCFSLDTVDPHSFRGVAPLLWPEVIAGIKTISAQRNKDIEIVITTTVTRENIDKVKTDLLLYVESIILDVFNKTKQHYPLIRPPIWKCNIFQPLKGFPDGLKRSIGITYDEFALLHDEALQMMRERVREYLAREDSSFTVEQVLRMNKTLQEEKSYKYLMILPNGVLVTTVDDGVTSYGLHERGFEVVGYLDKTNPWVYKKISAAIADGIDDKFSKIGAEFAPVVKVIKGSEKEDPVMGVLEKKISSFDQDSFDHLVVLHNKDEFPVMLGQEIAKRVNLRLERVKRNGDQWDIHFIDQKDKSSILTIWVNKDQHEVVYRSDNIEFYSRSQMRDVLEMLANRNVRLADQGYFERMTMFDLKNNLAVAGKYKDPTSEFDAELNAAKGFLKIEEDTKVYLVESNEITFGIARVREKGVSKLYVETSFLKRLKQLEDKTCFTRAFIHALYNGSSEEKVYQEFEYARSVYRPEQLNELIGGDFVGLNHALSNMIRKPGNSFQRAQADLIARRLKLQVWNMAVLRLNGETRHVRVRVNDRSPALTGSDEDSGDAKMLYYAVAANPLHFGHIEALLRAMAQSKADIGVIRVQGADDGKSLNGRTIEERHDIVAEFVAHMKEYVKDIFEYSDIGRETSSDGESDFIDLIKLNAGRTNGRLYAFNLGGSDHRHFFVPDYELWEKTREYRAKIKDGKKIPDTLLKYDDLVRRYEPFFKANNVSFGVLFSERDPRESEFLPEEVELVESLRKENLFQEDFLRGMNYEGASATAIREALSGIRNGDILMIFPELVESAIMGKLSESRKIIRGNLRFDGDRYRGFIIGLPVLIKQLSINSSEKDLFILEHWLEVTKQNRGREITSSEIVNMFNGKETPLSLEEVDAAFKIIKVRIATGNASIVSGGIDLTREKMEMSVEGSTRDINFKFDSAMIQKLKNASGFTPVIVDIRPMTTSVPIFFGLSDK